MAKNPNINFTYSDVLQAMKTPEVKAAIAEAYLSDFDPAKLRELVMEIAMKTVELGSGPCAPISLVLKDNDKARGSAANKIIQTVGSALAPMITLLGNSYVEAMRIQKGITQTTELGQSAPILNPLNHAGALTSLVELYHHLEPYFNHFQEKMWVISREEFYKKFFEAAYNPRQQGIAYFTGYTVLEKALAKMEQQFASQNDENRHLTTWLIDEFCSQTSKNAYQKATYLENHKYYKRFMNGIQTLNSFVKEVNAEGEITFLELPVEKQKKYIKIWVTANIDAYKSMGVSSGNDLAEIGFISGETEESRENAIYRFKGYLSNQRGKTQPTALPKKNLNKY